MTDALETGRPAPFPCTRENPALFNGNPARFEETFGVKYHGETCGEVFENDVTGVSGLPKEERT